MNTWTGQGLRNVASPTRIPPEGLKRSGRVTRPLSSPRAASPTRIPPEGLKLDDAGLFHAVVSASPTRIPPEGLKPAYSIGIAVAGQDASPTRIPPEGLKLYNFWNVHSFKKSFTHQNPARGIETFFS